MTTPHPPATSDRPDDIKQRYLQASAEQNLQPGERVRQAALAHAQMVAAGAPASAASNQAAATANTALQPKRAAANRWNFSLVASVAVAAIGTLLAFQFDRSDPQDKAVVMGTPSVTTPPTPTPALPASEQVPSNQTMGSNGTSRGGSADEPGIAAALASQSASASPVAPKSTGAPSAAKTAPQANKDSAKSTPAEALARPAPATAPVPAPAPSTSAAEQTTQPNPMTESAPATGATQSEPQFARSKSATIADAKSNSTANVESRAQSSPQQRSAAAGAQPAEGKSRTAPANTLSSNVIAWHQAARTGQIVELDRLLQLSGAALVNRPDDKGRTALMLATLGGHMGLVQRLVSAGADASLKDAEGKTAGQMARQLGLIEISNILNKQPASQ